MSGPKRSRLLALDVCRGIAILAMIWVHTGPRTSQGMPTWSLSVADEVAAPLFVVLMGASSAATSTSQSWSRVGSRALWLTVLGLALGLFHTDVLIILPSLAVLLLAARAMRGASARALWAAVVISAVVLPVLVYKLRPPQLETPGGVLTPESLGDIGLLGSGLKATLFHGTYPVVGLLPYLLLGVALGSWLVRGALVRLRHLFVSVVVVSVGGLIPVWLAAHGLGACLAHDVAPDVVGAAATEFARTMVESQRFGAAGMVPNTSACWLVTVGPHSGTTTDYLLSGGLVALIVLAVALLCQRRRATHATTRIACLGRASLSAYALHIVAIFAIDRLAGPQLAPGVMRGLAVGATTTLAAWGLIALFGHDPLTAWPRRTMDRYHLARSEKSLRTAD